tara:strand:+ start:533 stop:727 length:195 start_codon:yes stop_codon:yes gene_type:complete
MRKFLDKYKGQLTLNSDGFECLTDDLENIIDKYTGVEGSSFMKCTEVRIDIIELIHQIVNNKDK